MVTADIVQKQLEAIGVEFRLWGKAELRELERILVPNETVVHCVKGRYEGGFAVLVTTDKRLLLIDKKPFFLTLEDFRYDMISEIEYDHRLLDSTVRLRTSSKELRFTSTRINKLRALTAYTQDRMMAVKQNPIILHAVSNAEGVTEFEYQATNPYTKVPLIMRKRVSRFYTVN